MQDSDHIGYKHLEEIFMKMQRIWLVGALTPNDETGKLELTSVTLSTDSAQTTTNYGRSFLINVYPDPIEVEGTMAEALKQAKDVYDRYVRRRAPMMPEVSL
jgi:hypothetical protein